MRNLQKLFVLLTCISLIVSISFIRETYAKYVTAISGNATICIAKWNIKVNTLSVKNNSDFSSVISPVFPGNSNIASNIIAPNAEGYFNLDFDFSEVDVSFDYIISISINKDSSVTDLIATGYSIDDGEIQSFDDSVQTITGHINYSDKIAFRSIRVHIKWDDSVDAIMDNTADTQTTLKQNNSALLDINISFTQTI